MPAILQLNWVENAMLCNRYASQITNVMCSNKGTDYKGEVIWQCETKMPSAVKFMKTTVSCEGCTSSVDKLKISGSCAIFYQLGSNSNVLPTSPTNPTNPTTPTLNTTKSDDDIRTTLFIICIVLIFFGIYICYCANDNSSRNGYRPINYPEAQPYQATAIEIETTPLNTQRSNNYRRYNVQPSAPPAPVQTVPVQTVPVQTMPMQNPIIINAQQQPLQPQQPQQSSTGNLLGGYLTGQNLERGNYGAALLTSTMSSGGSDYNTGLMMGIMSESNNSHKHKHKKHHLNNDSSYYQNTYDNSHTDTSYTNTSYTDTSYTDTSYADTTTR